LKLNKINKDIFVSPIAIGGNIFGYSCTSDDAYKILSFAENNGINFVDTADVYSNGESEKIIGNAIKSNRYKWIVASKIGVISEHDGTGVLKPKNIVMKLHETLKRLNTDFVDIYQIHKFDHSANREEVIYCLEKLIEKGLIRSYGISNFSTNHLHQYHKIKNQITTHQLFYNFLKRDIYEKITKASSSFDHKFILYGVLGRGILTSKYFNKNYKKNTRASISNNVRADLKEKAIDELITFDTKLKEFNTNLLEYSIAEALSRKGVVSCVIGIREINQLKEIISILNKKIPIRNIKQYEPNNISNLVNLGEPKIN